MKRKLIIETVVNFECEIDLTRDEIIRVMKQHIPLHLDVTSAGEILPGKPRGLYSAKSQKKGSAVRVL